ncbi:MAG: hypothetical protein MJ178_10810 [Treponemataceae bacterium]|nr:hypothetical protein [Treponemataceae bacterium]
MNDLMDLSKGEIKIFSENGTNQVEVILQDNSIWLSAEKIGQLFDNKDRSTIQRHIKNIYTDDELEENSTCAFFAQVQREGKRTVKKMSPEGPIPFRITSRLFLNLNLHQQTVPA